MRKLLVPVLFACLVAVGCSQQTKKETKKDGTKPGATPTKPAGETKPETTDKGDVTLELAAVEVEEGKDAESVIAIKATNKEVFVIEFDVSGAEGVKVEPAKVDVKPGDKEAKVKVSLEKDKKGGKVKVKATGKDVKDFSGDLEVKKK